MGQHGTLKDDSKNIEYKRDRECNRGKFKEKLVLLRPFK